MTYSRHMRVEFNHCDPAGIVFYPRYFEMTNSLCENFFREVVGYPYSAMMADGIGVPTVRIETHFAAPSRLGDVLDWRLFVEKLGKTSVTFRAEAWCEAALRVTVHLTLVWLSPSHRPAPWPAAIRACLLAQQEKA